MKIIEPGKYTDISIEDYHGNTNGLSSSAIKLLLDCPKRYQHAYILGNRREDTEALIIGSAVHTMLLEPELFETRFYVTPKLDMRKNVDKAILSDVKEKYPNHMLLNDLQHKELQKMVDTLKGERFFMGLMRRKDKQIEQSVFWNAQTKSGDFMLKARPDYYNDSLIIDLKTTDDIRKFKFASKADKLGYAIQAAMLIDGLNAHGGNYKHFSFMLLAVEKKAPFLYKTYYFSEEKIQNAREKYLRAIELYRECSEKNVWPGYSTEPEEIGLNRWESEDEN